MTLLKLVIRLCTWGCPTSSKLCPILDSIPQLQCEAEVESIHPDRHCQLSLLYGQPSVELEPLPRRIVELNTCSKSVLHVWGIKKERIITVMNTTTHMSNLSKYNGNEISISTACVYAFLSMRTIAVKRTQINAHPTVLWATRGQNLPPDSYCLWYTYLQSRDIKMVCFYLVFRHVKIFIFFSRFTYSIWYLQTAHRRTKYKSPNGRIKGETTQ